MKKFVICLLLAGFFLPGHSQNSGDAMLNEIGVLLGPGFSTINGGDSWGGTFGFQLGIETQVYKWNETSSIYAGVLLSRQGASYEETYSEYDYYGLKSVSSEVWTGKVNLTYIAIPILFNYLFDCGFYGEGGIQPAFLISAKDKVDGESSYDFKDYVKTVDIGIPIGAGYWFNDRISLGARAVFGITNLNDSNNSYESDVTDRNFTVFGVVRYKFNKK